jgi:hypothetical protein
MQRGLSHDLRRKNAPSAEPDEPAKTARRRSCDRSPLAAAAAAARSIVRSPPPPPPMYRYKLAAVRGMYEQESCQVSWKKSCQVSWKKNFFFS